MPKPILRKNNLVEIINENIKLLSELDKTIEIKFINQFEKIFLECDQEQLGRVFLNLIKNSIESIQQKCEKTTDFDKKITIELNQNDSQISVVITDNGIGFSNFSENIKDLLNPYITTKKNGTGLGLSIVNKIVNDHNGKIEFLPTKEGAKIKVIFIL
tara:strand:- start:232 stop:705 length:474 start_codon:yes stop_codon:yes gene_type:complete